MLLGFDYRVKKTAGKTVQGRCSKAPLMTEMAQGGRCQAMAGSATTLHLHQKSVLSYDVKYMFGACYKRAKLLQVFIISNWAHFK